MVDEATARLGLPLIQPGQAQKELDHNEALALLDAAVQPVVEAVTRNDPPASPALGQCWLVGAAPTAAWQGHAQALAVWTSSGWRFVAAFEGMAAWSRADAQPARFIGGAWRLGDLRATSLSIGGAQVVGARQSAIAAPAGGSVIDTEARARIGQILDALRAHGLIAR